MKTNDTITCIKTEPLDGNTVSPDLEFGKIYPLKNVTTCSCGKEHFDVGLPSEYNYVSCHACKEHLKDGDKIHWCHPSRFVLNESSEDAYFKTDFKQDAIDSVNDILNFGTCI